MPPVAALPESWLHYVTTDAQVIGALTWVGLAITIAGFWVAISQIRKVKKASEAAHDAVFRMVRVARSQEQNSRVIVALEHLTSAHSMMKLKNQEAMAAHLSGGWKALIMAREMTDVPLDQNHIESYILTTRRMLDDVNAPSFEWPVEAGIVNERHYQISGVIEGLGAMSARLNAGLTGIGRAP